MTVAAQLALAAHRLEYFLCIQGIGWPSDETDLSDGFDGDVWVTADFDGDIASQLGCTVHHGLNVDGTLSDSVDPVTAEYSPGSMSFRLVNADDWWVDNFKPHSTSIVTTTLSIDVEYGTSGLRLTDGTSFADGDVIWIGNQEAVLLAGKALVGGTEYSYTGCTRGYLGTTRGRANRMPSDADAFTWESGASVYSAGRIWASRLVELYAHVPGESAANALRIFSGKLKGLQYTNVAHEVSIAVTGDPLRATARVWRARDLVCGSNTVGDTTPPTFRVTQDLDYQVALPDLGTTRNVHFDYRAAGTIAEKGEGKYAPAAAYRYRTERGGTAGMRIAWDAGSVQALDSSNGIDTDVIMRYVRIGNEILLAKKRVVSGGNPRDIVLEAFSSLGHNEPVDVDANGFPQLQEFKEGTAARFLLDNYQDAHEVNSYAVDKKVVRHPINFLLSHLTSRDDEYWRGDSAAGSTSTVVQFTPGSLLEADLWIGAALHCVDGANKGESRLITDNTITAVTVDEAFSNAPGTGNEYQIRNSIYDTLPIGWGLGVPWRRIDIASFENIRDKAIPDARIGRFLMGTQDKINLWTMLRQGVLQAYGILVYWDRATGKLAASYLGHAVGDGIIADYVTISDDDIIEIGEIDYKLAKPIGTINVKVRQVEEKVVGWRTIYDGERIASGHAQRIEYGDKPRVEPVSERVPAVIGGDTVDIEVKLSGLDSFSESDVDEIEIPALLNTVDDSEAIEMRALSMLRTYAVPPPQTTIVLPISFLTTVRTGSYLVVSKATGPLNPFLNSRGWSQVVCLVIGTEIMIGASRHGIRCQVQLLTDLNGGKIAPAAQLSGAKSGSDGTSDYFEVAPTQFVNDAATQKDYYTFSVGDRLQLHDEDGSLQAATVYTIRSFGANDVADPESASSDIIRVNESVPAAGGLSTDMYLSFATWSASNTTRMDSYAAYADANGALTGGDAAKDYA